MRKLFNQLHNAIVPYLTASELKYYLGGTQDSRQGVLKRAVANGDLIRIKRGLYCLSERLTSKSVSSFELAHLIYGPSVISCESALSYYNLIPEAVYVATSVTPKRSNEFTTPIGEFSYLCVPNDSFMTSVRRIKGDNGVYFMATPWRAICDYIYCYKKNWIGYEPLVSDLRIDLEDLPELSDEERIALDEYYHSVRITKFLQSIEKMQRENQDQEKSSYNQFNGYISNSEGNFYDRYNPVEKIRRSSDENYTR